MTRFLDVKAVTGLIKTIGVEKFLSELADYIADDYAHWQEFQKSPRAACHHELGVIEVMPAANNDFYGFKYVNGHPANTAKGLPTVMAFGAYAEMATGLPLLLTEMTVATALRTAATSAVAAKACARKDSRVMAVIGCGAQSEFQILAFKAVLGIDTVRVFDVSAEASAKLVRNLGQYAGLHLTVARSIAEAVEGADIVTTLTAVKGHCDILPGDLVRPGMHLNAVGGDGPGKTELNTDILKRARVIVEFAPQTRVEGEIQRMPADFPVTELWEVIQGLQAGRARAEDVTLFDSVGFALEDFSTLRYLNDVAIEQNAGVFLDLIPSLPDPRDLYGLLAEKAS